MTGLFADQVQLFFSRDQLHFFKFFNKNDTIPLILVATSIIYIYIIIYIHIIINISIYIMIYVYIYIRIIYLYIYYIYVGFLTGGIPKTMGFNTKTWSNFG